MIYDSKGRVRLTRSKLNMLRKHNAQQGRVLGPINTVEDHQEAVIDGLPDDIIDDMLEFFETGDSPLQRQGRLERAAQGGQAEGLDRAPPSGESESA